MGRLDRQVAIVTGSAHGIGASTASRLAEELHNNASAMNFTPGDVGALDLDVETRDGTRRNPNSV